MSGRLSELFRNIEAEQDVHELTKYCLESLRESVNVYSGTNLVRDFKKLVKSVYETEPKMSLIIDQFNGIMDYLYDNCRQCFTNKNNDECSVRKHICDSIDSFIIANEKKENELCNHGKKVVLDGDVILIHSYSRSVMRVLCDAYDEGVKFQVIVAEQEFDKTLSILRLLQKKGIFVKVVPEYMLSHIENDVTKVFMGVVTLNSQMLFVAAAGTSAIVSEFRLSNVPIYVFMSMGKMSLWKSHKGHDTHKVKHKKINELYNIEYERIKFSHDRVPLNYVNFIVTEEGIFNPKEIEKIYWSKYKIREGWNSQHQWNTYK